MTAGDPTRADIERAAAKLFGPAGARAFCDRVERAALLAALSISQEAYAEDQIQKRTGCWAVAPEGDKEVLVERASGRAMDHPDGTPLEQYWTPHKHKDEDLADELLELFRGVENWTLLTKVETSCDRILIAGGANVEAEWEQGPAV